MFHTTAALLTSFLALASSAPLVPNPNNTGQPSQMDIIFYESAGCEDNAQVGQPYNSVAWNEEIQVTFGSLSLSRPLMPAEHLDLYGPGCTKYMESVIHSPAGGCIQLAKLPANCFALWIT